MLNLVLWLLFWCSTTKQYSIPAGLSEYLCVCRDGEKPLMLLHLVDTLKTTQTIVFTSSVDTTHRSVYSRCL
jgi:superfamily II DNA/RNA helicase